MSRTAFRACGFSATRIYYVVIWFSTCRFLVSRSEKERQRQAFRHIRLRSALARGQAAGIGKPPM